MKTLLVFGLVYLSVGWALSLDEDKTIESEEAKIKELSTLIEKIKTEKRRRLGTGQLDDRTPVHLPWKENTKEDKEVSGIVGNSKATGKFSKNLVKRPDLFVHECHDKCDSFEEEEEEEESHERKARRSKKNGEIDCESWCQFHDVLDKRMSKLHKKVQLKSKEYARNQNLKRMIARLTKLQKMENEEGSDDENENSIDDSSDAENTCNTSALEVCVGELEPLAELALLTYPLDENDLHNLCSFYDKAKDCIASSTGCTNPNSLEVELFWTGIANQADYVCGEDGSNALEQYQQCVTTNVEEFVTELLTCLEAISELPDSSAPDVVPSDDLICAFYTEVRDCIANAAKDSCDSYDFVEIVFNLAVEPSLNALGSECSLAKRGGRTSGRSGANKTMLLETLKKFLKRLS